MRVLFYLLETSSVPDDHHNVQRSENIRHRLFALPHEPDYSLVKNQSKQLTDEKRAYLCAELESVLMSMSHSAGKMFRVVDELPCMDNVSRWFFSSN